MNCSISSLTAAPRPTLLAITMTSISFLWYNLVGAVAVFLVGWLLSARQPA